MTAGAKTEIDRAKVEQFQHKVMLDIASAAGFACAYIGDRLGLYKAMAKLGPVDSVELAKATNTYERYVREWLLNQAAGGYVSYDRQTGKYTLSPEHAQVLADEMSPFFAAGGIQSFMALMHAAPKMVERFQTGQGLGWGEQEPDLFQGTERFFRPAYLGQLVAQWVPSIPGLKERLESGAVVADVGCGHGVSTLIMARAFPKSRFYGFDLHQPSIDRGQQTAAEEGLADRVSFQQSPANDIADKKYDLICFFDCLHDMGDPLGACRRAKETLKPDGCLMIVEPMAGRKTEENFNDVGRVYAGASVLCCTPNAIAGGGTGLGTLASDDALAEVLHGAGFKTFRRATETVFNRVFEARL